MNQLPVVIKNQIEIEVLERLKIYNQDAILIVTDENVSKVYSSLLQSLAIYPIHVFKREEDLVPDEKAVGEVVLRVTPKTQLIVSVGSGVLNDLCRFVSYQLKLPYLVVMSAPSMDGYASTVSPIIIEGFKKTFYCHRAEGLYGDTEVLIEAPMPMILSGLGDFIGKVTALMDWQLSAIITKEVIDQEIVVDLFDGIEWVRNTLYDQNNQTLSDESTIRKASPLINEWLIKSGIHMATVGNSRPASGMEHLMSHVMEMDRLEQKKANIFHGIKVGVSTDFVLSMYELLVDNMDVVKSKYRLTEEQTQGIMRLYEQGILYQPMIKAYRKSVSHLHDLSQTELVHAMCKSIEVRDRFVVGTVLGEIGLLSQTHMNTLYIKSMEA